MLKMAFQGLRDIMWNHVHEFGEQPAHRQISPVVTLNVKYWNNNPLVDYSAFELRRWYVLLCPSHKSSSVLHCKFWTQNMLEKGILEGWNDLHGFAVPSIPNISIILKIVGRVFA